uniref:FAST kinase leucine-rich domain-containing protein n=1 Tax=Chlamydomonas leiostraca TaxID=1034604 RepID=A0A7S0RUY0_9CHLO
MSTVMWSLSRIKYKVSADKQRDFLSQALQHLPQYTGQGLSMLLYALGATEQDPGPEWTSSLMAFLQTSPGLNRFNSQGLALVLWALARMGYEPTPRFTSMVHTHLMRAGPSWPSTDSLPPRIAACNGIDVATIMYGMGRMHMHVTPNLLTALLIKLKHEVPGLDPAQMSNVVWALAQFQVKNPLLRVHPSFLAQFFSMAYLRLDRFTHHDLAMTSWALAKMRVQPPAPFLSAFLRRVEQAGAEFSPQEVSNTIWSLARFGVAPSSGLMVEFFVATDKRLSSFKPQELSAMAWALARGGHKPDRRWSEEFLHATFHKLPEFSQQGLCNMIWALPMMGMAPTPAWLYQYVKVATPHMDTMNKADMVQLVVGLTALSAQHDGGLQKVLDLVEEGYRQLEGRLGASAAQLARLREHGGVAEAEEAAQQGPEQAPDGTRLGSSSSAGLVGALANDGSSSRQQQARSLHKAIQQ